MTIKLVILQTRVNGAVFARRGKSVALIHKLAFCCFVKFELGLGVIETNLDLSGQVPLSSIVPLFSFIFRKNAP